MTIAVQPIPIEPIPHGPSTNDPEHFDDDADELVAALPTMITQQNAANAATYQNALAAAESAAAAADSVTSAALQARAAAGSASEAAEQARTAKSQADRAGESAAAAANSAATLNATSTSSHAVGSGVKVFVVQAGKQFGPNQTLKIVNPANADQWMVATVNTYDGTQLSVTVTAASPTALGAVVANWFISLSGERGPKGETGGVNGGSLTDALNQKIVTLASTASPEVWAAGGDCIFLTGSAAVTGFPIAPQAGAMRSMIVNGTPSFTESANLIIKGGSFTATPGDEIIVRAETTTKFRITRIKADGTASSAPLQYQNAVLFTASTPFIPPYSGFYEITLYGAAGQGGIARAPTHTVASGAGGGGFCKAVRWLVGGQTYMFNSGAGTSARGSNDPSANGQDGGITTFSGPGITTMTANGGKGGKFAAAGPVTGGDGGTASGGDINNTGGRGGNITGTSTGRTATGGGAINLLGVARHGGDAVQTAAATATGGASPGGDGGAASAGGTTGGGGMGGSAPSTASNVAGVPGVSVPSYVPVLFGATSSGITGFGISGTPSNGPTPSAAAGGATGGVLMQNNGTGPAAAGMFAATGGFVVPNGGIGSDGTGGGAAGKHGGASGGVVYDTGNSGSYGGATDPGSCLIRYA